MASSRPSVGVLGQDEVPAVAAVLAAVGDDLARLPHAVLARLGEQVAAAAAVDADDDRLGLQHPRSVPSMRVISGALGGRKLVAPDGLTTRPTTDKVRQAVFNSLAHTVELDGAVVVDLFAGSGALGIEALSRGAERCTFVERDRAALAALRTNIAALGLDARSTVVTGDVLAWVPSVRHVDVAFVDPPYEFDGWPRLLGALDAALVIAEAGAEVAAADGWSARRARRYGRTWVTVLERVP